MSPKSMSTAAAILWLVASGSVHALDKVSIGNLPASSSWCFIIAEEKGYFREEHIEADVVPYNSGAKMIPQLSAGQLDVGAGSASSGLYNAFGRGIDLKIVADAVRGVKGAGQSFLVRKKLLRSGAVKSIADLKGRTVAVTAEAGTEAAVLAHGLKTAGLRYQDVNKVFLPFAQHSVAYQNGAIDASLTAEPAATAAIRLGVADRLMFVGDFYPDAEVGGGALRPEIHRPAGRRRQALHEGVCARGARLQRRHPGRPHRRQGRGRDHRDPHQTVPVSPRHHPHHVGSRHQSGRLGGGREHQERLPILQGAGPDQGRTSRPRLCSTAASSTTP